MLDGLARFPIDDPEVYIAIVKLADFCGLEESLIELSETTLGTIATRRRDEINDVRNGLRSLISANEPVPR